MIDSCEKETELKLSMTKPTAVKSDASKGISYSVIFCGIDLNIQCDC